MKKILIILLSIFLLAALAVPAMAAGSASLSVSDDRPHRGDTFTVTVSVSGMGACRAGGVEVTYDSKFELTGGEWLIDGTTLADFNVSSKDGVFALDTAKKLSGKILKLTFKVKKDAKFEAGTVTVKLSLNADGGNLSTSKKVTVTCDHKYGNWTKSNSEKHSRTCSICKVVQTKEHTYDHGCDTACNDCGASRTTTHSFGTDWVSDATGHWHGCSVCGEKNEFAEHVPGAPAGEYTDQTCMVCNFVLATALGHTHTYDGSFLTDDAGHRTACLGCGEETEMVPHTYDSDCDTVCDICQHKRAVLHKEAEAWENSATEHWKLCTDCSARLYQAPHTWDSGTVVTEAGLNQPGSAVYRCTGCGYEKLQAIPAQGLTEALPWWLWLIIGAAGGMILTAGIGMIIILPGSRRRKGRFSN